MIKRSVRSFFHTLVSVAVIVYPFASASAQSQAEDPYRAFSEAYAAYTSAIDAGDDASALPAAKRAYQQGLAHFGRVNGNTGALAMNYANMLALAGTDSALAAEMFREADGIYEELYGASSLQRVQALQALASVQETYDEKLASINASLIMHRAVFPDDDIAYARLQSYSGELLAGAKLGSAEAKELLSEALDVLEEELGEDSLELVSTLFALGSCSTTRGATLGHQQLGYFNRALEIVRAAEPDNSEAIADFELRIGGELTRHTGGYREALPYVRSALEKFEQLFGANHPKTALATLTLGVAFVATKDGERAIVNAKKAIEFYSRNPTYTQHLIRAHQILLTVYDGQGNDELFSKQLIETGRQLRELIDPADYLPLYKHAPAYPLEAASRGAQGYVVVEYTVDEEGRTRDLAIVESGSERGRGEMFHEAALASVRKYRYIPRFRNGAAVSVPGVRTTIRFEID